MAAAARGLKRKCPHDEGEAGGAPARSLQRQSLLDMSLVKLQLCHMLAEPSLCRSVLLANTVRQIQGEMTRDGSWQAGPPPGAGQAPPDRLLCTDLLCRPEPEGAGREGAPAPGGPPPCLWEADGPGEGGASFPRSLGQILGTLGGRGPRSAGELFPGLDGACEGLDAVLAGAAGGGAGPGDGLPAFGSAAAAPPSCGCPSGLGEPEPVAGVLVGA